MATKFHHKDSYPLLRRTVRALLESSPTPGDVAPSKQVHVFDFDDTLAVTKSPTGVMLLSDGEPAHETAKEAEGWLRTLGISSDHFLKGPGGRTFEKPSGRQGFAAYIDSAALAALQGKFPPSKQTVSPATPTNPEGDTLFIDFTSSAGVDDTDTEPVNPTLQKMKRAEEQGAETVVITARTDKPGVNFSGETVHSTNTADIRRFLSSQGITPSAGVVGVQGGSKGDEIIRRFFAPRDEEDQPEEIHFYDDHPRNTADVASKVGGNVPAETFIYGPGEFAAGEADPESPDRTIPASRKRR